MKKKLKSAVIIITVLLSLCFLLESTLPAYAVTNYLSENFENFSTGWTLTGTSAATKPMKSGEQYHGGSYSAVTNTTASEYGLASRTLATTITVDWHYEAWLYVPVGITQTGTLVCGPYTGSAYIFRTCLMSNATGYFILIGDPTNASWKTSIQQVPADTWFKFEAYYSRTTKKVHVYIDDVNQTDSYADPGGTDGNCARIHFGDPAAAAGVTNGKFFIDDLTMDDSVDAIPREVTLYIYYNGDGACYGSIGYNGTLVSNGTVLTFQNYVTVLRLEAFAPTIDANCTFEAFYFNSSRQDDYLATSTNPINLTLEADYDIIANFTTIVTGSTAESSFWRILGMASVVGYPTIAILVYLTSPFGKKKKEEGQFNG